MSSRRSTYTQTVPERCSIFRILVAFAYRLLRPLLLLLLPQAQEGSPVVRPRPSSSPHGLVSPAHHACMPSRLTDRRLSHFTRLLTLFCPFLSALSSERAKRTLSAQTTATIEIDSLFEGSPYSRAHARAQPPLPQPPRCHGDARVDCAHVADPVLSRLHFPPLHSRLPVVDHPRALRGHVRYLLPQSVDADTGDASTVLESPGAVAHSYCSALMCVCRLHCPGREGAQG
jgi:hypothetical protein